MNSKFHQLTERASGLFLLLTSNVALNRCSPRIAIAIGHGQHISKQHNSNHQFKSTIFFVHSSWGSSFHSTESHRAITLTLLKIIRFSLSFLNVVFKIILADFAIFCVFHAGKWFCGIRHIPGVRCDQSKAHNIIKH